MDVAGLGLGDGAVGSDVEAECSGVAVFRDAEVPGARDADVVRSRVRSAFAVETGDGAIGDRDRFAEGTREFGTEDDGGGGRCSGVRAVYAVP